LDTVSFVVSTVCFYLLEFLQLSMLLRAVLSWLPLSDDNKLEAFVYSITEPIIYPIRALFDKFEGLRNFPLDIPFFVAFIILSTLSTILSHYG